MNYYKIIADGEFIGVGNSTNMICYQVKHNIILGCSEKKAEYIICDEKLYRADWMLPVNPMSTKYSYTKAEVIAIEEEEYNALVSAIEKNEEIVIEPETPVEEAPEYIDPNEVITVDYVKNAKIAEMSNTCNKVITNGFDVTLSDGNSYHFSLTTQDQLNLITLSSMVASGETQIPYHADGELCRFYSAEDINIIITTATQFKTYQVSYFNALKAYIESMTDIETIGAVVYGIEIPAEHQSDVLKVLLAAMATGGETE